MTRRDWTEIALAIAAVRRRFAQRAAQDPERRVIYLARVQGADRAAAAVCKVLEKSARFDGRVFMKIITAAK